MTFWRNPRVNAGLLAIKLRDSKRQINFFQRAKIIPCSVACTQCGKIVSKINYKRKKFRCDSCKKEVSVFRNTFMQNMKVSIRKVMTMMYLFTMHPRMTQAKGKFIIMNFGIGSHTSLKHKIQNIIY